jgi:hypothetical protein
LSISDRTSTPSPAQQKQILLECMLKDPKHSWLKHLDNPQSLRACVRLYLGKLSVTCKSGQRV